jgi:hypothetical protein
MSTPDRYMESIKATSSLYLQEVRFGALILPNQFMGTWVSDDTSPELGAKTSTNTTGPFHGRRGERGGCAPGERRRGRQQGSMNRSTVDHREEVRLHVQRVLERLVYLAHHAKRERDQWAALKLFLDYAYGLPLPRYVEEEPIEFIVWCGGQIISRSFHRKDGTRVL